jgi:hypothetical protein
VLRGLILSTQYLTLLQVAVKNASNSKKPKSECGMNSHFNFLVLQRFSHALKLLHADKPLAAKRFLYHPLYKDVRMSN